jgi:plastocyanin
MVQIPAVILGLSLLFACPIAWAGEVAVSVLGSAGEPAPDAVVALTPDDSVAASAKVPGPPMSAVIDQRNETFVPLVTVLHQGGTLTFRNSDTTQHHVYSFSAIKQFQFVLNPGDQSQPVTFDQPGLAAIGCNIHDHMIAYVYAARSPWTALSTASGQVRFEGVPEGPAHLEVWHPRLASAAKPVTQTVVIGRGRQTLSVTLALTAPPAHSPHHSMDY